MLEGALKIRAQPFEIAEYRPSLAFSPKPAVTAPRDHLCAATD